MAVPLSSCPLSVTLTSLIRLALARKGCAAATALTASTLSFQAMTTVSPIGPSAPLGITRTGRPEWNRAASRALPESVRLSGDTRQNRHVGDFRAHRNGWRDKILDRYEIGVRLGVASRGLGEPFPRLALLQRHLLLADIDQLLEVDGAKLSRIRQARGRRGTRL